MHALDQIDQNLLRILRVNGRISNAELAQQVGLSPSSCLRRVRILEHGGVIRGYAALIETHTSGDGLIVMTRITLDRQTEEYLVRFEAAVRRCAEVQDCYLMTGDADYLIKIKVADPADYERLHKEVLSRLPGVARIQSSFAIRAVVSPVDRR